MKYDSMNDSSGEPSFEQTGTQCPIDRPAVPSLEVDSVTANDKSISVAQPAPRGVDCVSRPKDTSRYQFLSFIAKGGMGEVWRARDAELKRDVAVKILKEGLYGGVTEFVEEARLVAGLEHPAIVPIHDAGNLADGRPFFVMKLITGAGTPGNEAEPPPTLQQLLGKETALPIEERPRFIQYCQQICEAVGYAHARRPALLHRDIKPSNIMVGAFGEILVMDWGLAKEVRDDPGNIESDQPAVALSVGTRLDSNQSSDSETRTSVSVSVAGVGSSRVESARDFLDVANDDDVPLETGHMPSSALTPHPKLSPSEEEIRNWVEPRHDTVTGVAKGTAAYMPPEQANGRKDLLCPATDVFSLGGLLVAVLTGKPIYLGPTHAAVMNKACTADLTETFHRLDNSGADPELLAVARKALAVKTSDRYANAGELARAIGDYRYHVEQRLIEAEKKRRRQRTQMIYLASGAIVLIGAIIAGFVVRAQLQQNAFDLDRVQEEKNAEEKRRSQQEQYVSLRETTELISSRKGNWPREGLARLFKLYSLAETGTNGDRVTIRGAILECLLGIGYEQIEALETGRKISRAAYSPDGNWLALADRFTQGLNPKFEVTLHNAQSGEKVRTFSVNKTSPLNNLGAGKFDPAMLKQFSDPDSITGLCFSSDSRQIAFCTKYGMAYWGDVNDPPEKLKSTKFAMNSIANAVRILPDNRRLLVCLEGTREVAVVDTTNGNELFRFKDSLFRDTMTDPMDGSLIVSDGHPKWFSTVDYSRKFDGLPNGSEYFASAGTNRALAVSHQQRISVIDLNHRVVARDIREPYADKAHEQNGHAELAGDPRGRFLLSSVLWSPEAKAWDLVSGQQLFRFSNPPGLSRLAVHPSGDQFTVTTETGATRYALRRQKQHQTVPASAGAVLGFQVSRDGKRVITAQGSPTGKARLFQYDRDANLETRLNPSFEADWDANRTYSHYSISQHENMTAVGVWGGVRWFPETETAKIERAETSEESFAKFGPSGQLWMAGDDLVYLKLPGKAPQKHPIRSDFFTGRKSVSAIGTDETHAVIGMVSGHLWIFPVGEMTEPRPLELKNLAGVTALRSIKSGSWLAALRGGIAVRFQLSAIGGEAAPRTEWKPHDGAEIAGFAVLSPELIVTAGKDQTLALWLMKPDNSAPEMLCRWKTSNPVRQIEYDYAGDRLYWVNEREYGLHDLHMASVWKLFSDDGAVVLQRPARPQ